jgi:hypothetical protein
LVRRAVDIFVNTSVDERPLRLLPERFRAKWIPVRVKKTRQNKNLELRF